MINQIVNKIINNDNNMNKYITLAVAIYISCFSNLMPKEMKLMFKCTSVKLISLISIAYLSTKNFQAALMFTIIYFAFISCSNEGFSNLVNKGINMESNMNEYSDLNTHRLTDSLYKNMPSCGAIHWNPVEKLKQVCTNGFLKCDDNSPYKEVNNCMGGCNNSLNQCLAAFAKKTVNNEVVPMIGINNNEEETELLSHNIQKIKNKYIKNIKIIDPNYPNQFLKKKIKMV